MDESPADQTPEITPQPEIVHPARLVVFGVMSVGFLLWVAFGQIEARVWVSGKLTLLDRRIASMWHYLGQNLPDLPAIGIISLAYWLSITVIVVGTVAGLWLFLGTPDSDPEREPIAVNLADHVHHEAE